MRNLIYFISLIVVSYNTTAQITQIPDPNFEYVLIQKNIDSDGVINGQILTEDALAVTELFITSPSPYDGFFIEDLTGLEAFVNIDSLTIISLMLNNGVDVSTLTNLKYFHTNGCMLESIDLSNNTLLEEVHIYNGGDIPPINTIDVLDLSNNPNIRKVRSDSRWIKLNNGNNNPDMQLNISCSWCHIPDPTIIEGNVCIVVDNPLAAFNNEYPYSEWEIFHHNMTYSFGDSFENCSLSTDTFTPDSIKIFPNPVDELLYVNTSIPIQKVTLYDILGRMVFKENNSNTLYIGHLKAGNYFIKISTNKGIYTQKIIVK